MDVLKSKTEDLRKLGGKELVETEYEVKRQLAEMRLDIYGNPSSGNKKKLKKTLARIRTVQGEQLKSKQEG